MSASTSWPATHIKDVREVHVHDCSGALRACPLTPSPARTCPLPLPPSLSCPLGTDDDWSDLEDFVVCQPDRDYHQLLRGRFRYAPVDEEEGEGQGEPEGEEGEGDEGKEEMEGEP